MLLDYAQPEWKMQQLIHNDVDLLLEKWERLKLSPLPLPLSLDESLRCTHLKDTITELSHNLRLSRLENNTTDEEFYAEHFCDLYEAYEKDFVFNTLKN